MATIMEIINAMAEMVDNNPMVNSNPPKNSTNDKNTTVNSGNGIAASINISNNPSRDFWTKSLFPPEMAKNSPRETRASRIAAHSHLRLPCKMNAVTPRNLKYWIIGLFSSAAIKQN